MVDVVVVVVVVVVVLGGCDPVTGASAVGGGGVVVDVLVGVDAVVPSAWLGERIVGSLWVCVRPGGGLGVVAVDDDVVVVDVLVVVAFLVAAVAAVAAVALTAVEAISSGLCALGTLWWLSATCFVPSPPAVWVAVLQVEVACVAGAAWVMTGRAATCVCEWVRLEWSTSTAAPVTRAAAARPAAALVAIAPIPAETKPPAVEPVTSVEPAAAAPPAPLALAPALVALEPAE